MRVVWREVHRKSRCKTWRRHFGTSAASDEPRERARTVATISGWARSVVTDTTCVQRFSLKGGYAGPTGAKVVHGGSKAAMCFSQDSEQLCS